MKLAQYHVAKMHPIIPISRRSRRIVILQKSCVIITREGIEFVRKRYSCSVALDPREIKLYEFLIRLLSFGGALPLDSIRKWRESKILKEAQKNHYVIVAVSRLELPKKEVQEALQEIWGKIPKGLYV